MKLLVALSALTLAAATSATACDFDYMFEASYVTEQVAAGAAEAEARAAQEAALAVRDQNLEAARQAFAKRFGLGVAALQVSANSSDQTSSDADRRTRTDSSYR
jgi:hypothetical protein